MNYTTNYKLPQWVETDRIMMEDFNDAMEKIEEGLTAGRTTTESGQQALSESLAALRETVAAHKMATGSYKGNDGSQTIRVGFTPALVFVHTGASSMTISGLALTGLPYKTSGAATATDLLAICEGGFTVIDNDSNSSLNNSVHQYHYFAIC